MKVTFVLAALATLTMAAPAESDQSGVASEGAMKILDANQEISLVSPTEDGDLSAQAFCGGFSIPGCSNICYWLGYRCYQCTSTYCGCNNWSC